MVQVLNIFITRTGEGGHARSLLVVHGVHVSANVRAIKVTCTHH